MEKRKEQLFFFAYIIYMVATVLQTTMYTELRVIPQVFIAMRYAAFVLAAVKVLWDLYGDLTRVDGQREKMMDWVSVVLKYVVLSALAVAVSVTADERSLAFLLVLLLAARGVKTDKLFRVTLWLQIFLVLFVFLSAMTGVIADLMFERNSVFNRHSLGYWFPSYIMSYYFFVLLLLFWTQKQPLHWRTVVLLEGLNLLLFLLTDARLGLLVNTGLIAVEFCRSVEKLRAPLHRFVDKVLAVRGLGTAVRWGWALLPELLCAFLVVLLTHPASKLSLYTDYFLSNRIYYAWMGLRKYGLHLLGNPIEWIGYGARPDMSAVEKTYNFVDCSYPFILLNFGVLVFLGLLFGLFWVSVRLGRRGDLHRAFLFGTIFIYCFVEPRLLEVHMNTFLFLMTPLLVRPPYLRRWQKVRQERKAPQPMIEKTS